LRTPLDPRATFADDPLRMLRAVRFRWQIGLTPAEGVYDAIRSERTRLKIISAERIQEELTRMLGLPDADRCLADLLDVGVLEEFAPELCALVGVEQGSFHHLDVWEHTLLAVRNAPANDLILRLAALLHDVGKPATRTIEADGRTRFFSHEKVGADMTRTILRRLKYSNLTIRDVEALVRGHMRLCDSDKWSKAAARRLFRDFGANTERLLTLVEVDQSAHRSGMKGPDVAAVRRLVAEVASGETAKKPFESPLTGEEIQELLGIEPGPQVGRVKAWLAEEVIEGRIASGDKDAARAALRSKKLSQDA